MRSREKNLKSALSFGGVAEVYEASRPDYPADAVAWLVHEDETRVVDVGAGTGKLTGALASAGREVIAVDPSPEMLAVLRRTVPGADTLLGTGEHLPLADATADAVTFAQAWHWVDAPTASAEASRVLKPGGRLCLIWNFRDERVDWVRELGAVIHADAEQFTGEWTTPDVRAPFAEPERALFEWSQSYSRERMLDLVRSRSYFAVMTPEQQHETLVAVGALLDTREALTGSATISMPYVTVALRYPRP